MNGVAPACCRGARFGMRRGALLYRAGRRAGLMLGVAACVGAPMAANAQSTTVVSPEALTPDTFSALIFPRLTPDYTRGHNVAVLEEGHPDYDAVGAAIGSFVLRPQVTVGVVADNNVYAAQTDRKSDISTVIKPNVTLVSDWSRNLLQIQAAADIHRFATQTLRNQNGWSLTPQGEADLGSRLVVHLEGQLGRYYESPYSSDIGPQSQVLSNFFRSGLVARATYTGGRSRFVATYDHSSYSFATLHFPDGSTTDQTYRDRTINRFTGQGEFGLSPSLALYAAGSADKTDYRVAQSAVLPKLDSTGENVIAGVSFDLAGVMRGTAGVGYSHRSYLDTVYRNVGAFSFQTRMDFFPFQLTTVALVGQRLVQDSALGSTPYIDTRIMTEIDQSLRENIVLILNAGLGSQSYVGLSGERSIRQFQATMRYQASRWLGFQAEFSYKSSQPNTATLGTGFNGITAGLSATVRR